MDANICLESAKHWRVGLSKRECRAAARVEFQCGSSILSMDETPRNPELMLVSDDDGWMRLALEEASLAIPAGEVPVGALVIKDGEIVGRGHNRTILDHDPSAHAEIVALREAAARLQNHRLIGCEMFVTIEPCAMCAVALVHARVARLVYGDGDPKAGAATSVLQVVNHPGLNHKMEVKSGVLERECSEILQKFFREKRNPSA